METMLVMFSGAAIAAFLFAAFIKWLERRDSPRASRPNAKH